MSKKVLIALLVLGILLVSVPMVLGATDNPKLKEIAKIQQQILDLRKQLVQKYVENGDISAEQGKAMQDRMDQAFKNSEQNGFQAGPGFGGGYGCGGSNNSPQAVPQAYDNL